GAGEQKAEKKDAAPAWHVPQAEMRYVAALGSEWEAPTEVFLADLKPAGAEDLSFDPKSKAAVPREVGKNGEGNPIYHVRGSATYDAKPQYKWLTLRARGNLRLHADNAELKNEDHFQQEWKHRWAVPAGAKTIKVTADCDWVHDAGFITSAPKAAQATLFTPGLDPAQSVPLVYGDDGRQVGAVTLWAHPGEPMTVIFDSSGWRPRYFIYLADKKLNLPRPQWAPEAGLIQEARYLDRYDPKVQTLEGFIELWNQSTFIAGKIAEGCVWRRALPFRPLLAASTGINMVPRGAPLALCRYLGFIRIPDDGEYRWHFKAWQGGFLVIDGNPTIALAPPEAVALIHAPQNIHKIAAVELKAGSHRVEVYQYGQDGEYFASLAWNPPGDKNVHIANWDFTLFQTIAPAGVQGFENREHKPVAAFDWPERTDQNMRQCIGLWPAEDIVAWQFNAALSPPAQNVKYRWKFDDGNVAEGPSVYHVFLRTGMREVALEALDAKTNNVVARVADKIHVQIRWDWPEGYPFSQVADEIKKRTAEFSTVTPLEEVLSVHAWACHNQRRDLRQAAGEALAMRLDTILAKVSVDRLALLGLALADADEQRYGPAEKLLRAALDGLPAGSHLRKTAALALADILTWVSVKPEEALTLLGKEEAEKPEVDLQNGWKMALSKAYIADPFKDGLSKQPGAAEWLPATHDFNQNAYDAKRDTRGDGTLPVRYKDHAPLKDTSVTGLWLAKTLALRASFGKKPLLLELGTLNYHFYGWTVAAGMLWFNNQPLGEPGRWAEARVLVPADLVRPGEDNALLILLQPPHDPVFLRRDGGWQHHFELLGPGRGEDLAPRFQWSRAEALLQAGKLDEARQILAALPRRDNKPWPMSEAERVRVMSAVRIIRRLAAGPPDDPDHAVWQGWDLLSFYPLLRLDPEVMHARMEAHLGRKEYSRAFLLASEMLRLTELSDLTRRQFMLGQVRALAAAGEVDQARKTYNALQKLSPYSEETLAARQAIIAAAGKH
ncbi:MAG: PKD domain-containing protein, partial [Planctomycetota bacterium]